MKFTLSWLREYLETDATLDTISKALTSAGLEVEGVVDNAQALEPFIVASIEEAVQHPSADKLRVCKVNDGSGVRQVVCGAPNARAGIKVVLAREGVKIPANGMVIKKSSIRGVESNGMLCSASELALGEDSAGIIELPASSVPGQPVAALLGADDPVIEIAVTPNRADCLGIYGIARDLAAAGVGKLKPLPAYGKSCSTASPITVDLQVKACPLFVGCYIKGVKNGPSPEWLQKRLKSIGLRPISALVDITNFMTVAFNRPLHVFDADKLKGNIHVRYARDGETLAALNGKTYTLDSSMVAVCDEAGVQGLGGIIGGDPTSCDENTKNVFLEAAWFDPVHIARTGRALSIESDARHRFERFVDPAFTQTGAAIAVALINELCGGEASQLAVAGAAPSFSRTISFNPARVKTLGGVDVSEARIKELLQAVGCSLSGWNVTTPTWRADIEGEADLVEEVVRLNGYDNIPSTALPYAGKMVASASQQRVAIARRSMALRGFQEIYSWAFLPHAQAVQFGGGSEALQLANPISADLDTMRPSLLPNLLSAAARNAARGLADGAYFEIGNVYFDVKPEGQKLAIAGIRIGSAAPRNSFKTERKVDVFDAKADLLAALAAAGLNASKLPADRGAPAWYHPARSGRLMLGGKQAAGTFGEVHPAILAEFGIESTVVTFEILLESVPLPKAKAKAKPLLQASAYQAVERDFAFMADAKTAAADITKAIEGAEKLLIRSVSLFDIYQGKGVPEGKKSIAISITLQASDRTLTDAEIEAVAQKVVASVAPLGLALRQ